eukprot:2615424-Pleurochrysis_carterae.AAC.1
MLAWGSAPYLFKSKSAANLEEGETLSPGRDGPSLFPRECPGYGRSAVPSTAAARRLRFALAADGEEGRSRASPSMKRRRTSLHGFAVSRPCSAIAQNKK